MRSVRAAIYVSSVQVSNDGCSPCGWSQIETRSSPSASARRASATGSVRPDADGTIDTPNRVTVSSTPTPPWASGLAA
jgi:hypothetical protein